MSMPYAAIPISRRYFESVEPNCSPLITGTSPHSFFAAARTADGTGPVRGELPPGPSASIRSMATPGSPIAALSRSSVCSTVSSGRMRQLTAAHGAVGSTLSAGAPCSWVATQVVRMAAL